jgi:uncharacterized membrane protein YcaP (DUF421 family)
MGRGGSFSDEANMFFESWLGLGRTILVGILAYVSLVLMLRVSGKRTLAKMNSFDLIVTVALGSALATVLLSKQVPLAEGLVAFGLLILLQYAVTWWSVRTELVRRVARAEPRLLLYRGDFLGDALRAERVTESEVSQAVRSQGILALEEVEGVVIETDGSFSVIRRGEATGRTSLEELQENILDRRSAGDGAQG